MRRGKTVAVLGLVGLFILGLMNLLSDPDTPGSRESVAVIGHEESVRASTVSPSVASPQVSGLENPQSPSKRSDLMLPLKLPSVKKESRDEFPDRTISIPESESGYGEKTLIDRTGQNPDFVRIFHGETMKLINECIAARREAGEEFSGLLAVGIELVADPEEGGVVEKIEAYESNEIQSPALFECIEASIYSAILPQPDDTQQKAFVLTVPI